jgi:hypothetical protein
VDTTEELDEVQLTRLVMSTVEESLYTPVAFSCCVPPTAMLADAGLTLIDCRVAAGTVRLA